MSGSEPDSDHATALRLALVDHLCRAQLAAHRLGHELRIESSCAEVMAILRQYGLNDGLVDDPEPDDTTCD